MERDFYNESFEDFLKENADEHNIYPSATVWKNIYDKLHGTKEIVLILLLVLLIAGGFFVTKKFILNLPNNTSIISYKSNKSPQSVSADFLLVSNLDNSFLNFKTNNELTTKINIVAKTAFLNTTSSNREKQKINGITTKQSVLENDKTQIYYLNEKRNIYYKAKIKNGLLRTSIKSRGNINYIRNYGEEEGKNEDEIIVEQINKNQLKLIPFFTRTRNKIEVDNCSKLLYINKEVDQQKNIVQKKLSKWNLQFYVSPIVSYRKLYNVTQSDERVPVSINFAYKIDNYVQHKPASGFEVGGKFIYNVSNNLSLFVGAQLNYSRYFINAYYNQNSEKTLSLNSLNKKDSVRTHISNFKGESSKQFQNQYLQVSAPMGVELKLLGNKRLQLRVAGSVQPSYLIKNSSYIISSDYSHYVENSALARKFNIHTSFETFISYQTNGLKWQLGPQFRSQTFSSYSNKFAIREYLTEYGIKLGITKIL